MEETCYLTDGCGCMVAIGSPLKILLKDKPVKFAENLKPEDSDQCFSGLPEQEKYCIKLALMILKSLISKNKKCFQG